MRTPPLIAISSFPRRREPSQIQYLDSRFRGNDEFFEAPCVNNSQSMRLTDYQTQAIRQFAHQVGGEQSRVRVFGSRLDDTAKGGDLDLLLELLEPVDNPALMAAQLSALVSRVMSGRKVDVLLSAPNLMHLPIHDVAFKEGRLL